MKTILLCFFLSSCAAQKQYGYKKNKDFGAIGQDKKHEAQTAHWMATITIVIIYLIRIFFIFE